MAPKIAREGKPQKSKKNHKLKKTFDTTKHDDLAIGNKRAKRHNLPVQDADLDRQDMPYKVKEMIRNKGLVGSKNIKRKIQQKNKFKKVAEELEMERGMTRPLKPIPEFVQGKKEKESAFMRRVEIQTRHVLMSQKLEEKYKVDLTNGPVDKDKMIKKKPSERKREKDKERKKKKLEAKQKKKIEKTMDFTTLTGADEVAFGDIVLAPPSLTAKPRKANTDEGDTARPGKRSLLLSSIFNGSAGSSPTDTEESESKLKANAKSVAQRQLGQSVKRKHLSPAQRQITDFQRQKAIDVYRTMRDKQYESNNLKS